MATNIEQAARGESETPAATPPSGCAKSCCTSRTAQSTPAPVPVVPAAALQSPSSCASQSCCKKEDAVPSGCTRKLALSSLPTASTLRSLPPTTSCAKSCCTTADREPIAENDEGAPLLGYKKQGSTGTSSGVSIPSDTDAKMNLSVFGLHCADCAANVEKVLLAKAGVSMASVSAVTGKAQIRYDAKRMDRAEILSLIAALGYRTEVLPDSATDSRLMLSLRSGAESATALARVEKCAGVSAVRRRDAEVLIIDYDPNIVGPRSLFNLVKASASNVRLVKASSTASNEARAETDKWLRYFLLALLLSLPCIFIAYIVPLVPVLHRRFSRQIVTGIDAATLVSWVFSTPVQFVLGWPLYVSAYRGLMYARMPNMDLLVMLSTTTAYVYSFVSCIVGVALDDDRVARSFFETSAILLTLILLGRYLEMLAKGRTSDVLSRVQAMQAATAVLVKTNSNEEEEIPADLVQKGDLLKVVPGAKIPVDGIVQAGQSSVNEAMITGEAMPVSKHPGSAVYGSSLNHSGVLTVRALRTVDSSTLAQLGGLVNEAQQNKAPVQRTADKVAGYFIPFILIVATAAFLIWYFLASRHVVDTNGVAPAPFALSFFLTVLVISCPCAIALAVPPAVMVGTTVAAKYGILFKGGGAVETAARVDVVAFDKTGTLTTGNIAVRHVYTSAAFPLLAKFLEIVASTENSSEHPIARAIVAHAKAQNVPLVPCTEFSSVSGKGVKATVSRSVVLIGTESWLMENQVSLPDFAAAQKKTWEESEFTVICVAVKGRFAGLLALSDTLRPEAREVVAQLKAQGKRVVMLSGDNERTVKAVARQLGIDDAWGNLLPSGKVERISALQARGDVVAMVGDGVNDSLALVQANLGVAVGSGAQLSVAAAQVVLVREDLSALVIAFDIATAVMRRIRMNFAWAFLYNVIAMPIASGALYPVAYIAIPPAFAGLSEVFSSLPVVFFSLLLARYSPPVSPPALSV